MKQMIDSLLIKIKDLQVEQDLKIQKIQAYHKEEIKNKD